VASLLSAQSGVWAQGPIPSVDTAVLTKTVRASFTAGEQAKVPVIQGTTHDEWRLFVAQAELATGTPVTPATYAATITATLGPVVASAAPYYPVAAYANASVALGALGTDAVFSCSGRVSGKLLAAVPNSVVYSYEFNDPTAPQTLPGTVSFITGSAHTSELQYLFTLNNGNTLTTAQRTLANTMVGYFTRFSRTGNPNGGTAVNWPAYTTANDVYLSLAPTVATTTNFAVDHKCNVWTPGV
jgi:para-nitrobenzyl esterase